MNEVNRTPYRHRTAVVYGPMGQELLVILIKASFRLSSGGSERSETPLPIFLHDQPSAHGATRYPSDLAPMRPGSSVICNGRVQAPGLGAVPFCDAEICVGELRRSVRAFGRRTWLRCSSGWRASEPEPFVAVPLGFERAFGGPGFQQNPIGMGVWGETPEGIALPQLEEPAALVQRPEDRPAPAGFGAIPPHWMPRAGFAGTYDDAWTRTRAPLLPDDFDGRFFHVATAGLNITTPLRGGERVQLRNLSAGGLLVTALPRVHVRVQVGSNWMRPQLDLVVIEPDEDRIALTFRVTVDVTGRLDHLPRLRIAERRLLSLGGESRP